MGKRNYNTTFLNNFCTRGSTWSVSRPGRFIPGEGVRYPLNNRLAYTTAELYKSFSSAGNWRIPRTSNS